MGLKDRLRAGERLLGTMVTTFAGVDIARLLQRAGFDFFIMDCEHGSFTTREVANVVAVARGIGMPALVRIPEMRREHALKFMELGASGLLLPNVESAEQARMLVDCTKYAPLGHRGVSLSRPHTDFRKVTGAEYMPAANEETILLCQIESRAGVQHIDEILSVKSEERRNVFEEAAGIVASLKEILDQTQAMSDDEVRSEIRRIAEAYSVAVTDAQVQQLLDLVRKLEGLDTGELQQRLTGLAQTAQAVNTVSDTISRVYESVKDFFASVGDFFVRLFGGGD